MDEIEPPPEIVELKEEVEAPKLEIVLNKMEYIAKM